MKFFKIASKIIVFIFCFSSLSAQMTVGSMVIGQGVTSHNDWKNYGNSGIYIDVNTSACGFKSTPHYLTTLESITNSGYHWMISGATAIYNPTPTGFRIYLQWKDHPTEEPTIGGLNFANPLRVSTAINRGWVIRWTGIVTGECGACNNSSTSSVLNNSEVEEAHSEMKINKPFLSEKEVTLFPNPSSSTITIKSRKEVTKSEIYNISSQLLQTTTEKVIDIEALPNGDYLVRIYFDDGDSVTKKFIKME